MKGRYTDKENRRLAFREWRRHIGAAKKVQFAESRMKFTARDLDVATSSS